MTPPVVPVLPVALRPLRASELAVCSPDDQWLALLQCAREPNTLVCREVAGERVVFVREMPGRSGSLAWRSPEELVLVHRAKDGVTSLVVVGVPDGGSLVEVPVVPPEGVSPEWRVEVVPGGPGRPCVLRWRDPDVASGAVIFQALPVEMDRHGVASTLRPKAPFVSRGEEPWAAIHPDGESVLLWSRECSEVFWFGFDGEVRAQWELPAGWDRVQRGVWVGPERALFAGHTGTARTQDVRLGVFDLRTQQLLETVPLGARPARTSRSLRLQPSPSGNSLLVEVWPTHVRGPSGWQRHVLATHTRQGPTLTLPPLEGSTATPAVWLSEDELLDGTFSLHGVLTLTQREARTGVVRAIGRYHFQGAVSGTLRLEASPAGTFVLATVVASTTTLAWFRAKSFRAP